MHKKLFVTSLMLVLLLGFGLLTRPQPTRAAVVANVNFQNPSTTPPAGYVRDFGEPYGPRTGANQGSGLTYGWVVPGTSTPLNLSVGGTIPGNGRNRGTPADVRLATLMHMQADDVANFNGTPAEGAWEIAVANGSYIVTVNVGDSTVFGDTHRINIEGVNVINNFVSSSTTPFRNVTTVVTVNDGRLTVDATGGGINTKINYIDISTATGQPLVNGSSPGNGESNVPLNTSVSTSSLFLPNGPVDNATVTTSTVYLYPTSGDPVTDRVPVSSLNTTGGGDAITLTPAILLSPSTSYTFVVTANVRDTSGAAFLPFSATFVTGTTSVGGGSNISFTKVDTGVAPRGYTSLDFGPDGRLYATAQDGTIYHWNVAANGTLSNEFAITAMAGRIVIGMDFDPASTASNPILWVSHNYMIFSGAPHFSGGVSRLVGSNVGTAGETWTRQDYIVGLPRSYKDHMSNSLQFGPDGALYLLQGSISAMGDRDNAWGNEPETVLSAAVLRINVAALSAMPLPLNVATGTTGQPGEFGDLPDATNYGLGSIPGGFYNPQAPGAPVTLFATGIRNAYDLVWHTNGQLYVPTNGSAGGGNVPPTPGTLPTSCQNRIDAGTNGNYTGPAVPAVPSPVTQPDYLFRVVQGGYYGHPNPTRCEWVMNGGNPTVGPDPGQVGNHYPVGTQPDRNWRGAAFDFGFNKSPNGVIEYRNGAAFGGTLQGRLLVVRYSANDDIIVLTPGGPQLNIIAEEQGIAGFTGFNNPLDLTEQVSTGYIYVAEYGNYGVGSRITLLRPNMIQAGTPNIQVTPARHIFSDIQGGAASPAKQVTISNIGNADLIISTLNLIGVNANQFQINTPPALPLTITPGSSVTVNVAFNPTSAGVKVADLQIQSNDPDTPIASVELRGLGTLGTGGTNEPSLQRILDTFAIPVNTGDDDPATTTIHSTVTTASGGPFGDEVPLQRLRRAGPGPVTIEVLASYGNNSTPVSRHGWYPVGSPANKNEVFTVNNGSHQTLLPAISGPASFDPGTTVFGLYSIWPPFSNREVYSQDFLNTWETNTSRQHKYRMYPLRDANGVIVPNAYIVSMEEFTSGFDYNDTVYIIRNVEPAPSVVGGQIRFENLDWVMLGTQGIPQFNYLNTRLTFSRNQMTWGLPVHNNVTLRIHNSDGVNALAITGLTISDTTKFILPNGQNPSVASPLTIPPGGFYDLVVRFIEPNMPIGVRMETLTITSSDPAQPTSVITLAGGYMPEPEGNNELTTPQIASIFGITSNLGFPLTGMCVARGEEVMSPNWRRADPNRPVYVRQLAAYHGTGGASFQITGPGGATFSHAGNNNQTILPLLSTGAPAERLFNPTGTSFQVVIAGYNSNRCSLGQTHGVRFWPVRDLNGALIPNAYFVIQDYVAAGGSTNYDFNDNIFLMTNIEPANATTDLTVNITDSADPAPVGANLTYTVNVQNLSVNLALNAVLTVNLPASYTFISAPASCSLAGLTVTCNLGNLAGEALVPVNIVVNPGTTGTFNVSASVTTTSTEASTTNNADTESTQVVDPSNLPGTLTIIKQAAPEGPQTFNFNVTGGPGGFTLVDDGSFTPAFTAFINFQSETAPVPPGYLRDFGEGYGPRTGANQGTGLTFGWVTEATAGQAGGGTPMSIIGEGRDRNRAGIEQRLDTIMHMQRTPSTRAGWEIAVPNGTYIVTVSVGDMPGAGNVYDSRHYINVENIPAITDFQGSAAQEYASATVTVTVADGRLTIDARHPNASNTKINYVEIVATTGTPNNTRTFSGVLPGTYNITETIPAGWGLIGATCTGAASQSPITNGVSIQLGSGGNVTCTFSNSQVTGPAITLVKSPLTQNVVSGGTANFTLTATNIGLTPLSSITLVDPFCTTGPTLTGGDTNGNSIMDQGEAWTYSCSTANVTANFTNTAQVSGTAPDSTVVSATAAADVVVVAPGINLVKSPATQAVNANGTANFTLTATNTGAVGLSNVVLTDALCTTGPTLTSGDVNNNNVLDPGEAWNYTCAVANVTANFTNTAQISGTPPSGTPITATASASVVVIMNPAISVDKTPDTQLVASGGTASFTITVTNRGDVPLSNVAVTDPLCSAAPVSTGGDANSNNILEVTETWTYTCSTTNVTANFTNVAQVSGTAPNNAVVTASDNAVVTVGVNTPSISIQKSPDTQTVVTGGTANFTISVVNNGSVDLTGVAVTDALAPACNNNIGTLTVGQVFTYTCSLANVTADFVNTAEVNVGAPFNLTASDTAEVLVRDIAINKTPDVQTVNAGGTAVFTILISNPGTADLSNVVLTDALCTTGPFRIGGDLNNNNILESTEIWAYTCEVDNVTADFTNLADVSAQTPSGATVTANDNAQVTVGATGGSTGLAVDMFTDTPVVNPGATAVFTILVTNNSGVPMTTVTVTAPLCATGANLIGSSLNGDAILDPGETWVYTCEVGNITASFVITVDVNGTLVTGVVVTASDAVDVQIGTAVAASFTFSAFDPFITKTANPPFAIPGELVTFTFTITNPGPSVATNVVAVDPIPAEVEILSATAPAGTVTVNGQDVVFQIAQLQPGETINVTIETRVRPDVQVPFIITNEVCMQADGLSGDRCALARVISINVLPSTGEPPLWSIVLRLALMAAAGAGAVMAAMSWTNRRLYRRLHTEARM